MICEFRIATYNIHRAVGKDKKIDNYRILEVINEIDAAIIALQEVSYDHSHDQNILKLFKNETDYGIYEGVTLRDESGDYGNVILSRFPVNRMSVLDLSVDKREPRGAIELVTSIGRQEIQVVATHLGLRPYERRKQIRKLLPLIRKSQAAIKILLGDINEWFLWGLPLRLLHKEFGPMPAKRTFPAHRPLLALDRCWVSPTKKVSNVMVHNSAVARVASDHLPLVVDVKL